jgi:hypothetical protein
MPVPSLGIGQGASIVLHRNSHRDVRGYNVT